MDTGRDDRIRRFRAAARRCRYRLSATEPSPRELHFTPSEWEIWQEVAHPQGVTSAWVVAMLGIDRGLVSRILHRWERHEKLIHTAPWAHNGRIKYVMLSDIGRRLDRDMQAAGVCAARRLLDRLYEDEQERLIDALVTAESLLVRAESRWREMNRAF